MSRRRRGRRCGLAGACCVSITLVFFALFGTIFVLTQYLQFVLGYSPLQAGIRVMPIATMIVAAPLSARLAERFGTKIVVAVGMSTVALALGLASTVSAGSGERSIALSKRRRASSGASATGRSRWSYPTRPT